MPELPATTVGRIAELLVEACVLAGGGGRLLSFRPDADVDHKDVEVNEAGTMLSAYAQVKAATHPDREGRIVAFAEYPEGAVLEDPAFVYVVALLSLSRVAMERLWFVPSPDFNRLAYRQHRRDRPGRVSLQFSCLAAGDPRWDRYETTPHGLGERFLALLESGAAPAIEPAVDLAFALRTTR